MTCFRWWSNPSRRCNERLRFACPFVPLLPLTRNPAQVLLSRENLGKRHHYTNALNTFRELLRLGVVPIVNENDTVHSLIVS